MPNLIRNGKCCPFCGAAKLRHFEVQTNDRTIGPRAIHVVECRPCMTAWQWPGGLTDHEVRQYYDVQYNTKGTKASGYFDIEYKTQVSICELNFVEEHSFGKGSLLDVGAGAGIFVELAISRGWNAKGIDFSFSSEFVLQGTIDDIDGTYDVITMWDVIEHVDDPQDLILKAADRLTTTGVLIIETGNYVSTDRITNERTWWAWNPDHRWYHAPTTIEKLLKQAQFHNFQYSDKNLRPNATVDKNNPWPSSLEFMIRSIKRPHRLIDYVRMYSDIRRSARQHPHLTNVGIFAVAARR